MYLTVAVTAAFLLGAQVQENASQEAEPDTPLHSSTQTDEHVEVAVDSAAVPSEAPTEMVASLPLAERTVSYEMRLRRGLWEAGPWQGEARMRAGSSSVFGIREAASARADLTIEGPGFESGPLTISCDGGRLNISVSFITFRNEDLGYTCSFERAGEPIDATFELALARSRGLRGMFGIDRAGALYYEGRTLNFAVQSFSRGNFLTRKVPGYIIRDGVHEIAGMDYRMMAPEFMLPPEGDPNREPALIAALILATFMDPADVDH
ncbi:hypothetical protein [Maricaulis sp. CAU 1757]